MPIGFSLLLQYRVVTHGGHNVDVETSKYVIYTPSGGFQWDTIACTEDDALELRQAPSIDDQVCELRFAPK